MKKIMIINQKDFVEKILKESNKISDSFNYDSLKIDRIINQKIKKLQKKKLNLILI